ncbi:MAG: hypothetical protein J5J06_04765 [Phycisphaerae bacterium]|nr:hypothetical protein [Phycisphaerae bacterium]
MRRTLISRRVVFDETVEVSFDPRQDPLEMLRRAFLAPFDRAAHAVQVLGYEQDDAVIERHLLCQATGGMVPSEPNSEAAPVRTTVEVPAEGLSDAGSFNAALKQSLNVRGHEAEFDEVRIVALRVVAVLERWGSGS